MVGIEHFGKELYSTLFLTDHNKYRLSRTHFYQDQFERAHTGEHTTLKRDARAEVPLQLIWEKSCAFIFCSSSGKRLLRSCFCRLNLDIV